MDGISVAASVLAIATAGIQVSIKLVSLSNQVATARNRITSIGNDVSLTANILQQLAELMTKGDGDGGEKMNVFSVEGLRTAQAAADACHGTFEELAEVLKKSCRQLQERNDNAAIGKRVKLSKFEKLKWPFLQPSVDSLCAALTTARGTLMLLLQVTTLAYTKKLAELNPSSQLSADDQSLIIGAIVAVHKKKALSARGKAKIVESEESEGSNLRRNAELVREGDLIPSPISTQVSPKAKSSSSHAYTPDTSGVSGPQKVSENPVFQATERIEKTELELNENERERLQSQLVEIGTNPEAKQESIQFKDAVGRNYEFPFQFCNTWLGMEDLIKQAFLHVEVIGPHVIEGHYDLVDPGGNIILPQLWEALVEPNWTVTMHLWPVPEHISPEEDSPEEISPEVREAGKAEPGLEPANPEQTDGRPKDHDEVWILQPQIHPIHCGYDIRYGARKSLIAETDTKLRRRKFRRWKSTNVVNQLTKLLTKEREAVDQLCANILRDWVGPVELTTLDIVFRRMKPSKEPNTLMPWRSVILYIRVICDTDPRSKTLDAGQDQTRVRSNKIVEYKDLGSSIRYSEEERLDAILKDEAADAKGIIAKAPAEPDGEVIIVKAADEASTVAGKAMSGSPSSSRFETPIISVQSEETSDDEESESLTPELARKIVDNLLAEYTTLQV